MLKKKILITLIKSLIGRKKKHLESIKALGLKKINHKMYIIDNACNRGLIKKVSYLLKIENI